MCLLLGVLLEKSPPPGTFWVVRDATEAASGRVGLRALFWGAIRAPKTWVPSCDARAPW